MHSSVVIGVFVAIVLASTSVAILSNSSCKPLPKPSFRSSSRLEAGLVTLPTRTSRPSSISMRSLSRKNWSLSCSKEGPNQISNKPEPEAISAPDQAVVEVDEKKPVRLMQYALAFNLAFASVGFLLARSPATLMKPKLLQEPGLSIELFSLISSANTLIIAFFSIFAGGFIDKFGGMKMLTFQLYGLAACNIVLTLLPSGHLVNPALVPGAWLAIAALRGMMVCGMSTSTVMALRSEYPSPELYATSYNIMQIGTRFGDTASRCFITAFTAVTGLQSWRAAVVAASSIACVTFLPLLFRCRSSAAVPAPKKAKGDVNLLKLLATMVRSPRFLLLAAANGSVGLIAEIVTHWTDMFMYNVAGVSRNNATAVSSIASIVKLAGTVACGHLAAKFARSPRRFFVMQMIPMSLVCVSAVTLLGAMTLTAPSSTVRLAISVSMFAALVFGVQIHQDYILRYESLEVAPSKDVAARVHTMMGLSLNVSKAMSSLLIGQLLKKMSPMAGWQVIFRGVIGVTVVVTAIDLLLARMASKTGINSRK